VKTFTDAQDRTWVVTVDVGALKRVRDLCDVDLMDAIADSGKLVGRLDADPVLLCNVLYAICREQAEKDGVSDEEFGRGLIGDVLDQATAALLEDLADFFPARKRAVFAKAVKKANRYADLATERALKRLDDPALDQEVEKMLDEAFAPGTSSTPAPASSG